MIIDINSSFSSITYFYEAVSNPQYLSMVQKKIAGIAATALICIPAYYFICGYCSPFGKAEPEQEKDDLSIFLLGLDETKWQTIGRLRYISFTNNGGSDGIHYDLKNLKRKSNE